MKIEFYFICRLQRQRQLEKEVKSIPIINNELRSLICEYEAQYGEIVINGERFLDQLPEQEEIQPRSVESDWRFFINRQYRQFVPVHLRVDNEMKAFLACTIHLVAFLFSFVFYHITIFQFCFIVENFI